jgi:hypothetical protein
LWVQSPENKEIYAMRKIKIQKEFRFEMGILVDVVLQSN